MEEFLAIFMLKHIVPVLSALYLLGAASPSLAGSRAERLLFLDTYQKIFAQSSLPIDMRALAIFNAMNDDQKTELYNSGLFYCESRQKGTTDKVLAEAFINGSVRSGRTVEMQDISLSFYTAMTIAAQYEICPEFKN